MRQVLIACAALVVAACGGGGVAGGTGGIGSGAGTGGGGSVGECPDLSGSWVIAQHCESDFIGMASPVTQAGCSYTATADAYTCTGTINGDGSVTQTCDAEGGISCTGQLSGSTLTMTCDGCAVVMEKQ